MQTISLPAKLPTLDINLSLDLFSRREFYRYRSSNQAQQVDADSGYFFHQKIVQQFMMYNDHLMLIHEAGSGKTKTALSVMHSIKNGGFLEHLYKKIVIATPNDDLARAWAANSEIAESDKRYYEILTHYELSTKDPKNYARTIFIIDEVHKLANESVLNTTSFNRNENKKDMDSKYGGVWNLLHRAQLAKVMLLTATPFQNDTADFYPLMNLILPADSQIDRRFSVDAVAQRMIGRVSFVRNIYKDIQIEYDMSDELYNKIQEFQLMGSRETGDVLGLYGNSSIATIEYTPNAGFQRYRLPFYDTVEFSSIMFSLSSDDLSMLFSIKNGRIEFVKSISLNEEIPIVPNVTIANPTFGKYPDSEGSYMEFDIKFDNIADGLLYEEKLYLTLAVPGLLRSSIPIGMDNRRYGTIRSILGAAHTGYLRDVDRTAVISSDGQVENDDRKPDRRLIFSDEQQSFVYRKTPAIDIAKDVNQLSSRSKLYYHFVLCLFSTATERNRAVLLENNPEYKEILEGAPIEPGKSIFYSRYITKEYGIEFLADLLVALGYERLTSDSDFSVAKPRFALSPSTNNMRDMINHPDNWDGSRCQLILFSQRGATGFSYFDIRHIHVVPGWSPSENTQAIFRGIRAGGHKNFVQKAGYIPTVRVYIHTISPHLGQGVLTNDFYNRKTVINNKTFINTVPDTCYRFGWEYDDEGKPVRSNDVDILREPEVFDKNVSYNGAMTENGSTNVYYTNLGLAMRNFSATVQLKNLRTETAETYQQVIPYNANIKGLNSVLCYILFDSLSKDIAFSEIRRRLKSYAVDCELLKDRNTLPDGFTNTSECDYGSCVINCISDSNQIIGNDVDISNGSDPRRTRALAPLSHHRTTTHDQYLIISPVECKLLMDFIKTYMEENIRVNYYQLIKDVWEHFNTTYFSERHIEDVLLNMIYGKNQTIVRDKFDRMCRLSYMGELLYMVPLEVGPEFIHERYRETQYSGKYIQSDYLSIYQTGISNDDIAVRNITITQESVFEAIDRLNGKDIIQFMQMNFQEFVSIVEACYIGKNVLNVENQTVSLIANQFGMYFANIPRKVLQIYYKSGRESKSNSRVYYMEEVREVSQEENQNDTVMVNFLWHIFPSTVTPRGFISDFSYVRIFENNQFIWANDGERKSIIRYIKKKSKSIETEYLKKLTGEAIDKKTKQPVVKGLFGYIDYRNKLLAPENAEEYLMLVFKETKDAAEGEEQMEDDKALQGRACKSFTNELYTSIQNILGVELKGAKDQKCKTIERALMERNAILDKIT